VFQTLAGICHTGDWLYLDITHAFRHLTMLAVSSAMFLRQASEATLAGMYYGQFNGPNEIAPAVRLDAITEIAQWTAALSAFEHTGALGPIARCYDEAKLSAQARALRHMSFLISSVRLSKLIEQAKQTKALLSRDAAHPIAQVISPMLCELLDQRFIKPGHIAQVELQLAQTARDAGDWMRATIHYYESLLSAAIRVEHERFDYNRRDEAHAALKARLSGDDARLFKDSAYIRNLLAHGNDAPQDWQREIVRSEESMREFLEKIEPFAHRLVKELISAPIV
jgi:CRISPR-associated DxTHG motif protein